MTTIIKADSAHDFLALVPELAGFHPVESAVLVIFRANRTCGALRSSLPRTTDPEALNALASSLIGMACKIPGADALVPVIYTGERFGSESTPPRGELTDALIFHAELSGFSVRDALCVAGDGWASYLDAAAPAGGHSLALIAGSTVTARLDAEREAHGAPGRPRDDQHGPAIAHATADRALRQRVNALIKRLRSLANDPHALSLSPSVAQPRELAALLDLPQLAEEAITKPVEQLTELDTAALLYGMQNAQTRDELLLHWAFGEQAGERARHANLRCAAGESCAGVESARLLWGDGPRPDPKRIASAIVLLTELAGRAPRASKPAVLSMLAWLNWALGRSSRAAVYLRMVFEIDGRYSFAGLLDRMLSAGRLPEWAFAVPLAHQGTNTKPKSQL